MVDEFERIVAGMTGAQLIQVLNGNSDKIKIGLIDDYTLLYHLGDELGKFSPEYDSELFTCSKVRSGAPLPNFCKLFLFRVIT